MHSPARWSPYGRPESSRLLKVNHYMLHMRIIMCSGAYAPSPQDTDYAGAGVVRSFDPGSVARGPACLTSVCTRRSQDRYICSGPQGSSRPRPSPSETFEEALKSREHVAESRENNRGTSRGCSRGGDGVIKISQSLNTVIAADVRRPSHHPHSARRTRSKFAFLWPRSG
jgi:hypothetical protein